MNYILSVNLGIRTNCAPHSCPSNCLRYLRGWLIGTHKSMPFAVPIVWREQNDRLTDWHIYWHVYVLPPGYFVWPCSPHIHRTEIVTSHNKQKTKAIKCGALQVWPLSTMMPLESKRRQNTINNTDWNVSCYCNSKLPKTYTWSGTFILKDGRYTFNF
jgi:hypothetical protein